MTRHDTNYILPFEAAKGELLSQICLLRSVETELRPARQDRVIELLERLVLLGNDLREINGKVYVRAMVIAIAARIERRFSVSDRSVRHWTQWAEQIGVIETDVRSQKYGRREWNQYVINVDRIRQLCRPENRHAEAGSGRKWPETVSALRPEVISAPRPEVVAAPLNCRDKKHTHTALATDTRSPLRDTHGKSDTRMGAVVRVFLDLGVVKASTLVAQAIDRGMSPRDLLAIARWFERSQRKNPHRWAKPSTVLMLRLAAAAPGLPAHCGWIPGRLPQRPRPRVDHERSKIEQEKNRREWSSMPSPLEELRALQRANAN